MAALTITAVRTTPSTVLQRVTSGATLAVGVPVYQDASTLKHLAADCDASAATRAVKGVTVTPSVDTGAVELATRGNLIFVGATMTVGAKYYLGPTAGEIVPFADLLTGDNVVEIGTAISATEIKITLDNTGAVVA